MKKLVLICLCAFSIHASQAQTVVGDISFTPTMKAGDATLVYNGAGIREKLFIDVYVAGLYLTAKKKDADAIIKANEPMAVNLHIVSGLVTSDKMIEAVKEGFKKSTGGNTSAIQAKIDKFVAVFKKEPIVKGNVFDLVYTPAAGVQIYKGGKLQETIQGLDFKSALYGIWLGKDPVSEDLKNGMLGN